jgi:arylsulfatase A-like enzyme
MLNRPGLAALLGLGLLLNAGCDPGPNPGPEAESSDSEDVATERAPADERPDLVLIVVDTLRADHLSAYGYPRPTSPHLEHLAEVGTLFEDVTAQSSWTLPSMASLLTGRHMFVNTYRVPATAPTLAEHLRDAGYETVAFVANPALCTQAAGYRRGFGTFMDRDDTGGVKWNAEDLERTFGTWLDVHPPGAAPRFYYLHYLDPHWPYAPGSGAPLTPGPRLSDATLEAWVAAAGEGGPIHDHFDRDRRQIIEHIDAYDREIRNVDGSIRRLLDRLEEPGIRSAARERLVAVAADHGEGLWDHRHHERLVVQAYPPEERTLINTFFRDHSYHMFQELLFTPLIVSGPGFDGGRRVDTPVENVDLMPTFLRAAGLSLPPELEGQALQDVASGAAGAREALYSYSHEATMVRTPDDGAKLIFPTPTGDKFGMPLMLFDLGKDPSERHNRGRRDVPIGEGDLNRLRRLIALREKADRAFDLFDNEVIATDDDEQNKALRALGYTGEGFTPDASEPPEDKREAENPRDDS